MAKIITWVDLAGRYRVTSPAYNDPTSPVGETEDELIARVWAAIVNIERYGITIDHPHNIVEDVDQRARLNECCGTYFRYGVFNGSGTDGAWEMDIDGRPKVNMPKARVIHMDHIRKKRNEELQKLDIPFMMASEKNDKITMEKISVEKQKLRDIPQTYDLSGFKTPEELKAFWPKELKELDEKIKDVKKAL